MPKSKTKKFYIEDQILERAKASFNGPMTKENMDAWQKHWFATADAVKAELEAEGLANSAAYVDNFITVNKKLCGHLEATGS